jgi:hypothetical protein
MHSAFIIQSGTFLRPLLPPLKIAMSAVLLCVQTGMKYGDRGGPYSFHTPVTLKLPLYLGPSRNSLPYFITNRNVSPYIILLRIRGLRD